MPRRETKRRQPLVLGERSSNVVDMAAYRAKRLSLLPHGAALLTNGSETCPVFPNVEPLHFHEIVSQEVFRERIASRPCDIFFVDANLKWADPIATIELLHLRYGTPIVLVCSGKKRTELSQQIKQAYMAGVTDVLFSPFQRDDLFEIIEVLLKLKLNPQHH